jgi:RNase H-like domain found in reverse transcriptase
MKSLNDLLNLHDLFSTDTSNYSNNASKMPSVTYGTRDSPGHVALWIISLGTQKDAILQWLGKDELVKHKTVELAVKYIRSKLMEGRSQSESHQEFDSKLTPIRYEDIRLTQGESYLRQQIQQPTRQSHTNQDRKGSRDFKSRSHQQHLSAIHLAVPIDEPYNGAPQDFTNDDDANDDANVSSRDDDDFPDISQIYQQNLDILEQPIVPTLSSIGDPNTFRSAIAATFRGFCMEKFVFGKCSKQDSACSFDHSSAGQEKCIQSFNLLSKRDLLLHGQLPPWTTTQNETNIKKPLVFPSTQKQMQIFLGAANFFHTHIPHYATWASSLYECTVSGFSWDPTTWSKDYKALFDTFKMYISCSLTLHFLDCSLPWILRSDASDHAVGAVLFQEYRDSTGTVIHQPIASISHKFSGAAVNWDTFKQEAFALYFGVSKLSYYLRGKEFLLETDHRNLLWIESSHVPIVVRWRVLLQSFTFKLKHIPGKENLVADWLSRMYPLSTDAVVASITEKPSLQDMLYAVHGGRSLHHGAKRTYLALCSRYPAHGISLRVIQDLVSECPICQKDRIPLAMIPHNHVL